MITLGKINTMMRNNNIIKTTFCILLVVLTLGLTAQDDKTLFTIEGEPVTLSEFKYIYEKNNRENASYTKESLEEYLDLYINFKLKVQRAKELGLHEKESYKKELQGYRRQLADSYVIDKEVIDQIVDDLYERKKHDLKVSHILVSLKRKSTTQAEKEAQEKVALIQKSIENGMSFEEAVKLYSEDKGSANNQGNIGYLTATLPDGYVELENAIYNTPIGKISAPIRTDLGYHLVTVTDKRPARGKIEAQHILIRDKKVGRNIPDAKTRIDTAYSILSQDPSKWDGMARTLSEDKQTAKNAGNLGVFGISQYEESFESAAFSLKTNGDISKPVKSSIGWHIIRLKSKKAPETKEQLKIMVKGQMNTGERFDLQKQKVVADIQKEANYYANLQALKLFTDSLDQSFYEYNWTPVTMPDITLISYGNTKYTLNDFSSYGRISSKTRMKMKGQPIEDIVNALFENFVEDKAIAYAEDRLEYRYDDFKNLLREYEEGILLFEVAKNEVWDKASQDSVGLKNYYNQHKDQYVWEPRAVVTSYTIRTTIEKLVDDIVSTAKNSTPEEVTAKYNLSGKELVLYESATLERSSEVVRGLAFSVGAISTPKINNGLKVTTFNKIEDTIPASKKSLKESKGYVISDYQDQLEKTWINSLKSKFKVDINKKVFKSLIAKS